MKYNTYIKTCLFSLLTVTLAVPVNADELGRLFTTPGQRNKLQELRFTKPVAKEIETEPEIVIEPEQEILAGEVVIELEEEPEPGLEEPVSVKGLVYRENSSNTAWVNDANTYDGTLSRKNIQVREKDIKKDQVRLEIPGDVNEVTLKVGETYLPDPANSESDSRH